MSNRAEPELREIQAWLHTFVVEPGTSQQALEAAEAKAGFETGSAETLILPSPTLAPQERLEIYRGMYLLRMEEAMEIDFPAIQDRVGKRKFSSLVADYVRSYPSTSYTLDHLGRGFSEYLFHSNACDEGAFLSELASLEWAICMAGIAHDSPYLTLESLAEVDPERFVEMRLECVPALQLLTFQHNVNEVYRAWCGTDEWISVRSESTRLVVWRHKLDVWRQDLTVEAYELLEQLCAGLPLGNALDLVIDRHQIGEQECFEWFQNWLKEGFFSRYRL